MLTMTIFIIASKQKFNNALAQDLIGREINEINMKIEHNFYWESI